MWAHYPNAARSRMRCNFSTAVGISGDVEGDTKTANTHMKLHATWAVHQAPDGTLQAKHGRHKGRHQATAAPNEPLALQNSSLPSAALSTGDERLLHHVVGSPRYRHRCMTLKRICTISGTLVPADNSAAALAAEVAERLRVRPRFNQVNFGRLHGNLSQAPRAGSALARAVEGALATPCEGASGLSSPCRFSSDVPLVWVPTWAEDFRENFINSVVTVAELLSSGLLNHPAHLLPDIAGVSHAPGLLGFQSRDSEPSGLRSPHVHPACLRPCFDVLFLLGVCVERDASHVALGALIRQRGGC